VALGRKEPAAAFPPGNSGCGTEEDLLKSGYPR
jgi:hypothetical protein